MKNLSYCLLLLVSLIASSPAHALRFFTDEPITNTTTDKNKMIEINFDSNGQLLTSSENLLRVSPAIRLKETIEATSILYRDNIKNKTLHVDVKEQGTRFNFWDNKDGLLSFKFDQGCLWTASTYAMFSMMLSESTVSKYHTTIGYGMRALHVNAADMTLARIYGKVIAMELPETLYDKDLVVYASRTPNRFGAYDIHIHCDDVLVHECSIGNKRQLVS